MNYFSFKNKGLFVFSDPGGAKPILAFIYKNNLENYKVISDRYYSFFTDFNIKVEVMKKYDTEEILNSFKPDFLFTGTSYTSQIEIEFIKKAKEFKIFSCSFIDHYTNFKERFFLNKNYYFPEKIFVTDKKAKNIAYSLGLSKFSKINITGNFYYQFLKEWSPDISRINFFKKYNISKKIKLITFAPDPLSNVGGVNKYGFDEITVFSDLISSLESLNGGTYKIFIKFHPNQDLEKMHKIIKRVNNNNLILKKKAHLPSLLNFSDLVIGMFSSVLIESNILKTKTLRYLINLRCSDPFEGLKIGKKIFNSQNLYDELKKIIK